MSTVYSATYSGVPVYEFLTPSGLIMRRQADGWVNATHILKAANFPKARRTRILERDVQTGVHEKIQGGYGKYQGTWVPLERGRAIAETYAVDGILAPIFDYVATAGSAPPPAPKHLHAVRSATTAVSHEDLVRAPPAKRAASTPVAGRKRGRPRREPLADPELPEPGRFAANAAGAANATAATAAAGVAPAEERSLRTPGRVGLAAGLELLTSSLPSEFLSDSDLAALQLPRALGPKEVRHEGNTAYTARLLEHFMAPAAAAADAELPLELRHPPPAFNPNQIIDDEGNTPLHWACAIGNLAVCGVLLSAGAEPAARNSAGQTPLMRAASFTNAYTTRAFPRLCALLADTLACRDSHSRTVLHLVAETTASKARWPAARYYLDVCLAKLSEGADLALVVDARTDAGFTAVDIATAHGARKCASALAAHSAHAAPAARPPLPSPRFSEAAIQATQRVAPALAEGMVDLAAAYDAELLATEQAIAATQQTLLAMEADIAAALREIARHRETPPAARAAAVAEARAAVALRAHALRMRLERSQVRLLAAAVAEETECAEPDSPPPSALAAAVALAQRQLSRLDAVQRIVALSESGQGAPEKMAQYRKLIAMCAEVDVADVDVMLEGIEDTLRA